MQPWTGGDPEVTLGFSIGGRRYTLSKKLRGGTGSWAYLSYAEKRLERDAAEEELQRLLHVEEIRANKADVFNSQWAHLWVWQGSAPDEPSGTARRRPTRAWPARNNAVTSTRPSGSPFRLPARLEMLVLTC